MCVLLVDDEDLVRLLLSSLCETKGIEHAVAVDGLDALELCRRYHFDLVVTDLSMPNMDGIELARELRAIDPDRPIVAFTGRAGSYSSREMDELFDTVFEKPVDHFRLMQCIREHLARADERSDAARSGHAAADDGAEPSDETERDLPANHENHTSDQYR